MLVDSHCHLDFPEFAGRMAELIARMGAAGVGHALVAGVSLERFPAILELAETHSQLCCSVGVHPDGQGGREPSAADLVRLADHPRVVAIGETGLDYYRLTGDLEWQRERFRVHIRAARECGK
ncbi:MAG: TatD family hydrolase, partial [Rhodocyclaceae bacterium]|nr:TatD family hydrolase [Rhodocyclaceae bacterium]